MRKKVDTKKADKKNETKKTDRKKKLAVKEKRIVKSFKSKMNGKKLSDLLADGDIRTVADLEKCGKKAVIQFLRTKEKEMGKLLETSKIKEAINGIYWMPKEGLYPFALYFIKKV